MHNTKYSNSLNKAQQWAAVGGMVGGGSVALKQLLHSILSKKYRANYNWKSGLRNILLGGALGAGAGYGLNKGISNYAVHSLKYNPYGYTDKIKLFKPEGWDIIKDKEATTAQKKEALKTILKDAWFRTTTTPNLDNLSKDYKGEKLEQNGDWSGVDSRRELLARGFGVFDDKKGSLFRNLTSQEKMILKNKFPNIYYSFKDKYGEGSILTPNKNNKDFKENDLVRLKSTLYEYSTPRAGQMYNDLNDKSQITYHGPVMGNYTNMLSDDKKHVAYADVWDYTPDKAQQKRGRTDIKAFLSNFLKTGKLDFSVFEKSKLKDVGNSEMAAAREIVDKGFSTPIPVLGVLPNDMKRQKRWEKTLDRSVQNIMDNAELTTQDLKINNLS